MDNMRRVETLNTVKAKDKELKKLQDDIDAFLENGGKVDHIATGVSGQDAAKLSRKSFTITSPTDKSIPSRVK